MTIINPFNLIPSWATLVIGVLGLAVGAQQVRVANRDSALAEQVAARATDSASRVQLALVHTERVRGLESQHAATQQQRDEEYAQQLHKLEIAGAAGRTDANRLRSQLAAFTAGDRQPGETDAAAGQRARDRLPLVGALLAEGVGLEAESRAIIERRDAEVVRLLDQIRIDRVACLAP